MMGAPAKIDKGILDELSISIQAIKEKNESE